MAIYGFARFVDDVGDELPGDRARALDAVDADIDRVYRGGSPRLPALHDLAVTVRTCGIPPEPLRRLVQANRQDQRVARYATFAELEAYCELSANPVGEAVLYVFGFADARRIRLSDRVCTALQLIEHCQDVREDLGRGRVYLPGEDLASFGCTERELAAPVATTRVRELMAFQTRRAGRILDEGVPLVATLGGFARVATAGYVAGGRAALAAIAGRGYDVLSATPRPGRVRTVGEWLRLLGAV